MAELFGIKIPPKEQPSTPSEDLLQQINVKDSDLEALMAQWDAAQTSDERAQIEAAIDALFDPQRAAPSTIAVRPTETPSTLTPIPVSAPAKPSIQSFNFEDDSKDDAPETSPPSDAEPSTDADTDEDSFDDFFDEPSATDDAEPDNDDVRQSDFGAPIPVEKFQIYQPPTPDPVLPNDITDTLTTAPASDAYKSSTRHALRAYWDRKPRKTQRIIIAATVGIIGLFPLNMLFNSCGNSTPAAAPPAPSVVTVTPTPTKDPITVLTPSRVEASCPRKSTPAAKAIAPSSEQVAWICYRAKNLDGQIITFKFNQPVTLTTVTLTAGFNAVLGGEDQWLKYRHPATLIWRTGGQKFRQTIVPNRAPAQFDFPQQLTTQKVVLTILYSSKNKDEKTIFDQSQEENALALSHVSFQGIAQKGHI